MKRVVLLFVFPVLIVLTLSGCISAAATPAVSIAPTVDVSAIRTETARDVIAQLTANAPTATPTLAASPTAAVTEVKPTETLSPTYTPELKKTSTPVTTKVSPAAPATTKSPAAAPNPAAAANVADKFYAGYASCIGGTDVVHFLSGNSPGEIMEGYKIDRYNYTSTKQCRKSFEAKIDALKQVHVCVLSLPEPAHADLAAIRNSTVLALADLVKIREADFADRLCEEDKLVLLDDARVAYANAQKHLQYAQTMLDKYRSEYGK